MTADDPNARGGTCMTVAHEGYMMSAFAIHKRSLWITRSLPLQGRSLARDGRRCRYCGSVVHHVRTMDVGSKRDLYAIAGLGTYVRCWPLMHYWAGENPPTLTGSRSSDCTSPSRNSSKP